mgnify:CR=1 FL=1
MKKFFENILKRPKSTISIFVFLSIFLSFYTYKNLKINVSTDSLINQNLDFKKDQKILKEKFPALGNNILMRVKVLDNSDSKEINKNLLDKIGSLNSVSFIYVMPYVANRDELNVFSSRIDFVSASYKEDAKTSETVQKMSDDILNNMGKLFPDTLKKLKQSKKKFRRKGLDGVPKENLDLWTSEIVAGVEVIYKLINYLQAIREMDQWNNLLHGTFEQETEKTTWNYEHDFRIFSKQFIKVYGDS